MNNDILKSVCDMKFYTMVGQTENIDINQEVTLQPHFNYINYFAELIFLVFLIIAEGFLTFVLLVTLLKTPLVPVTTFLLLLAFTIVFTIALLVNFIFRLGWIKSFWAFNIFEDIPSLKINKEGLTFVYKKSCDFLEWDGIQNITSKAIKYYYHFRGLYSVKYRILILYSEQNRHKMETPSSEVELEYDYFFYNDLSPDDFVKYLSDWKVAVLDSSR